MLWSTLLHFSALYYNFRVYWWYFYIAWFGGWSMLWTAVFYAFELNTLSCYISAKLFWKSKEMALSPSAVTVLILLYLWYFFIIIYYATNCVCVYLACSPATLEIKSWLELWPKVINSTKNIHDANSDLESQ